MSQNKSWAKSIPGTGNMCRDLEYFQMDAQDACRGSLELKLKREVKPDHEGVLMFSGRH